jgi:hypothetical protein
MMYGNQFSVEYADFVDVIFCRMWINGLAAVSTFILFYSILF